MRVAMLSPMAWRTPPKPDRSGPDLVSILTRGLTEQGAEVTLFDWAESTTHGERGPVVCDARRADGIPLFNVWDCLHISTFFEQADRFDLIHNHSHYLPLSYSGLTRTPVLTTIRNSLFRTTLPIYRKYNKRTYYVSISDADRSPELEYAATIYHGIDLNDYNFSERHDGYLLFFGAIREEYGTREALEIAGLCGKDLLIAGSIEDESYFDAHIKPRLDGVHSRFIEEITPDIRDRLLGNALAVLHPISFDEPFGLSVVQANACGTPVIAFPRGSLPEIVTNGVNGFLVDDIPRAVQAVERIGRISRLDCRRMVERHFSLEKMVSDYLHVYSRILEENCREDRRPWGYYEVLSDRSDHKVKRIVVYPGKRLSLQRHERRAERWTIISGSPIVTRFREEVRLEPGQSIDIPQGARHRIANPGDEPVVFIEVQVGEYFGEDDIERFEDDFGRV
jgi:mannose-6-phosphate isomerase-like protein (cupin superfamily)